MWEWMEKLFGGQVGSYLVGCELIKTFGGFRGSATEQMITRSMNYTDTFGTKNVDLHDSFLLLIAPDRIRK